MHILAPLPEKILAPLALRQFSGGRFAAVAWCPKKSPMLPSRNPAPGTAGFL